MLPGNPEKEVFFVKSCSSEATCNGDFRKLGVPPSTSSAKTKTWQMVVVLTGLVLGFFWELGIQTLTLILHFRGVSDIKSAHPKISPSLGYLNFSELFPQAELKTWGCSACNKELFSPQPSPVVGVK